MFVSINVAQSIDGKIATKSRGPVALGTELDRKKMKEIRAQHDVIIMGAATYEAYPKPLLVKEKSLQRLRLLKGKKAEPATAVISSQLDLPKNTPFERARNVDRFVICGRKIKFGSLKRLQKAGVNVVLCRGQRPTAQEILRFFASQGKRRVLVEGGGELIATFLEADLVNRLYVTLCPLTLGGRDAPSFFEGNGFEKPKFLSWKLRQAKRVGSELYLIYDRK